MSSSKAKYGLKFFVGCENKYDGWVSGCRFGKSGAHGVMVRGGGGCGEGGGVGGQGGALPFDKLRINFGLRRPFDKLRVNGVLSVRGEPVEPRRGGSLWGQSKGEPNMKGS